MNPLVAAGLISAGSQLLGGFLNSRSASEENEKLMEKQYEYSKGLMDYQHQLNSPGEYVFQLKEAGLSPALMLSKGANQVQTSLGSTPSGDLAGLAQSKALNSQLLLQASQAALNFATAKKVEKETDKVSAETEGIMTDNQFKVALHQGNLDYMSAATTELLARADLDDSEAKVANQQYENLVKELDNIEAQHDVFVKTADKLGKEAALLEVEKEIRKKLADSEIAKNEQLIRTLSAQAYEAATSGDAKKIEAANLSIQNEILGYQKKYAGSNAYNEAKKKQHEAESASANSRYNRAKASSAESQAAMDKITADRKKSTAWLYKYTPLGYAREVWEGVGSALGGAASTAVQVAK